MNVTGDDVTGVIGGGGVLSLEERAVSVVFMGTSDFAVSILRALAASHNYHISLVLTRPDAISGRGKSLVPSPVKLCAEELSIPVITPRSFYLPKQDSTKAIDTELQLQIKAHEPDFIVVASYGMILPQQVLDIPQFGSINVHSSLLPRWRGAAPIQRAILAGDEYSGVSIMRMEAGLDTGAVCRTAEIPLAGKNAQELTLELAELGARLLLAALPQIANGTARWQEQPEEGVSYADKIDKVELILNPNDSAVTNIRRVLASTPQAPARCLIGERAVAILRVSSAAGLDTDPTGNSVRYLDGRLILSTIDGYFEVIALKPDGKREMNASSFVTGFRELQKGAQGTPEAQAQVRWSSIKRETT